MPDAEEDKKSETEWFKESPASDVAAEESVKSGQHRSPASEVECTA